MSHPVQKQKVNHLACLAIAEFCLSRSHLSQALIASPTILSTGFVKATLVLFTGTIGPAPLRHSPKA